MSRSVLRMVFVTFFATALFVTAQDFEHQLAEMLAPRDGSIDVSKTPTPRIQAV